MDIVDQKTRSRIMSSVPQRDTKPELLLRHALHGLGLRYRLHERRLPGRPDLVFPRFRAVIFVHGCYWHFHGCKFSSVPATRSEFWQAKFDANRLRDAGTNAKLIQAGWRVLVVWECALKPPLLENVYRTAAEAKAWLEGSEISGEIGGSRSVAEMGRQ